MKTILNLFIFGLICTGSVFASNNAEDFCKNKYSSGSEYAACQMGVKFERKEAFKGQSKCDDFFENLMKFEILQNGTEEEQITAFAHRIKELSVLTRPCMDGANEEYKIQSEIRKQQRESRREHPTP